MLTRVWFENYKGCRQVTVDFAKRNIGLVLLEHGGGKSSILEVLAYLQAIARGAQVTRQVFIHIPYAPEDPLEESRIQSFGMEVNVRGALLSYAFSIVYNRMIDAAEIVSETFSCNGAVVFDRCNYAIDKVSFALTSPVVGAGNREVSDFRDMLSAALFIRPNIDLVSDRVSGVREFLAPNISNLANWMVNCFTEYPSAYMLFDERMRKCLPDFGGVRVHSVGQLGGRLVLQRKQNSLKLLITQLSYSEMTMLVVALMCAILQLKADSLVVWDDFLQGIERPLRARMIWELRASSRTGQLVVLTANCSDEGLFAPNEKALISRG